MNEEKISLEDLSKSLQKEILLNTDRLERLYYNNIHFARFINMILDDLDDDIIVNHVAEICEALDNLVLEALKEKLAKLSE
jgi:phosphoribosylformylglycinamidine (FGAM) synthase PurS component